MQIIVSMCDPYLKMQNFNMLFIVLSLQDPVYCTVTRASQVRY